MKDIIRRVFFAQKPEHEKTGLRSLEELQRSLYRVSVNYPFPTTFVKDEGNAILIGRDTFVSLSSDNYMEIAPGIYARVITGPKDMKYSDDGEFANAIRQANFSANLVIFVRFLHGDALKPHFHNTRQKIHCLAGSYIGTLKGQVFSAGDVQDIPARHIHMFQPIQDGYALIEQAIKLGDG